MKKSSGTFVKIGCAILVGLVISQNQSVLAGYAGVINGAGVGWASVNVRSATLQSNRVSTLNNVTFPSAAMSPTTGYKTNAPLPAGASTNTYSRLRGLVGGQWSAAVNAAVGDGTDHAELQKEVTILPADCATLTFDSMINQTQEEFSTNGHSGTITVNAKATAGTALWLRGFEFTGSMDDLPSDNPDTVENETIEYLKVHGVVKFVTLILGPFEFGGDNCPLIVPFTLTSSNLDNLIIAADGAALSLPLVIVCPPGIETRCDEPFAYPPVQYAGCGEITITYDPAPPVGGLFPAGAFPVGVTPVTVTATDAAGHSTNCTFTVTVTDSTTPVIPALPTLTGQCSVTVPQPAATTDNCGGTVTATTSDPLTYTNQGTFTVHWTFDDGNGNSVTANQTVIIDDTIPPVAPVLPTVTGDCATAVSLTPPTATDNCAGTVTGTTTTVFPITTVGTTVVTWTFDDGNGNTSTANQTVIVAGITFDGFFSPIGGTGGTCQSPLRTANLGNNLPVKFKALCNGSPIMSGHPTIVLQQCSGGNYSGAGDFALVGNEWHFNWNTSGRSKGVYELIATLQDGSKRTVFIRLK